MTNARSQFEIILEAVKRRLEESYDLPRKEEIVSIGGYKVKLKPFYHANNKNDAFIEYTWYDKNNKVLGAEETPVDPYDQYGEYEHEKNSEHKPANRKTLFKKIESEIKYQTKKR